MAHHVVDPVNLLQVHAVAFDAPDHCPYLAVLPGKREHETRAGGEALGLGAALTDDNAHGDVLRPVGFAPAFEHKAGSVGGEEKKVLGEHDCILAPGTKLGKDRVRASVCRPVQ
ncbi:hypothetical protein TRIP_E210090 [uncultured Spirochaetota bacterium]|uniref:Uncharacterized protein n=1 Tax=uncultured Spirochaetota bacterium TaxID=460511 RepID=A0A652ZVA9_9SPIR|nr:hypothetical protein TRIP_E210090 [uncultured Spirochaetota bacterium]